ncbi:UDP-N-acetylmuramoyl-L-alanine--D-glutamate ligase [Treponema phagedenis]|uniref:UDP-N-acetylmuramoyl-L-alanine--D-glutamate ligase n=1 Tax=Treponema phagedenis TaxID=162 RepID=UPI0001F63797|nr:UDP-N-acetylmuramoyl-L-alanine--D-glutamate ligase [Treponema phagedenis]EFW36924.1 UDP-N-acetylmuramoyl-L-alanine--D-glutamate ligase [Treponema phagedenis F0421]TYT76696.1 UDP-N-acetylmuramoyl-L-alanine--D-glutamate ligase [Treponema phagedenis]
MIDSLDKIKGLRVTVMGLGLNGGGLASARFFAKHGAVVTVTDMKSEKDLEESVLQLKEYPSIRFVLGRHDVKDFESADLVIKNPAVKRAGNVYLDAAKHIESDVSVFLRLTDAPILAVTGSKGKSSTVSALQYGLQGMGFRSFLGGNITISPLDFLSETGKDTPVVLELSSWQLADLRGKKLLKPEVAVITPVMPDHQNWYGSMEAYVADKKLLYADQTPEEFCFCNYDDQWGKIFASETVAQVFWYSIKPLPENLCGAWLDKSGEAFFRLHAQAEPLRLLPNEIMVPGSILKENVMNAAAAIFLFVRKQRGSFADTALSDLELAAKLSAVMKTYPGLEHRLEFFYEQGGVRFYNDTTATVPEATAAALDAFTEKPVLICGGTDKKLDFTPIAEAAGKAKEIFLLAGTGTDLLAPLLEKKNIAYRGPFANLDDLLICVKDCVQAGDRVVFSPGATSFGMFQNEFDRGRQFKIKVQQIFTT